MGEPSAKPVKIKNAPFTFESRGTFSFACEITIKPKNKDYGELLSVYRIDVEPGTHTKIIALRKKCYQKWSIHINKTITIIYLIKRINKVKRISIIIFFLGNIRYHHRFYWAVSYCCASLYYNWCSEPYNWPSCHYSFCPLPARSPYEGQPVVHGAFEC
jgi:hypothetical protein